MLGLAALCAASVPSQFQSLYNQAKRNAYAKGLEATTKGDSFQPGEYQRGGLSFTLLKPLTGPTTKDVEGFAIEGKYLGVVAKTIDSSFVFVDPETQKLHSLDSVEYADEEVKIYKTSVLDQFSVFSNIRMELSSNPCEINTDNILQPTLNCNYPINVNWDETVSPTDQFLGRPKVFAPIKQVPQFKVGAGAYTELKANAVLYLNSLFDVRLEADLQLLTTIGALVRIDPWSYQLDKVRLKEFSYPLGAGISFKICGFQFKAGFTFDVEVDIRDILFELKSSIEYYRGYRISVQKSIVIQKSKVTQSDWDIQISRVPSASISEVVKELVTKVKLELTPAVKLQLSCTFSVGSSVNSALHLGVEGLLPFEFSGDVVKCPAPYLYGAVTPRVEGFISFEGLSIVGKELLSPATASAPIYQSPRYQMCLYNPKTTSEGDEEASVTSAPSLYTIAATNVKDIAKQDINPTKYLTMDVRNGNNLVGSIAYPGMKLPAGSSTGASLDPFMILNKPPTTTTIQYKMWKRNFLGVKYEYESEKFGLIPKKGSTSRTVNTHIKKEETTYDIDVNIDTKISEKKVVKSGVSIKLDSDTAFQPTVPGDYVYVGQDKDKYRVDNTAKFYDEARHGSSDVQAGSYSLKGRFYKLTFTSFKQDYANNADSEYNLTFIDKNGNQSPVSVINIDGAKKGVEIDAKTAKLKDWSTYIHASGNGEKLRLVGTTSGNSYTYDVDLNKYSTSGNSAAFNLIVTNTYKVFFSSYTSVIKILFQAVSPTVVVEANRGKVSGFIARSFRMPQSLQVGGAQMSFFMYNTERYGVLEAPIGFSFGSKARAYVRMPDMDPLIENTQVSDDVYAFDLDGMIGSLQIPFRRRGSGSQSFKAELIGIGEVAVGAPMFLERHAEFYTSQLGRSPAILVDKKAKVKVTSGIFSALSMDRRPIDDSLDLLVIASPSTFITNQIFVDRTDFSIPEGDVSIVIDTTYLKKALEMSSEKKVTLAIYTSHSIETSPAFQTSYSFIDHAVMVTITSTGALTVFSLCGSRSDTMCLIRDKIDSTKVTLLDYQDATGIIAVDPRVKVFGSGVKRELITNVGTLEYYKTWKGEVKVTHQFDSTPRALSIDAKVDGDRTVITATFGGVAVPLSRRELYRNMDSFMAKLGVHPAGEAFEADDVDFREDGSISYKTALRTGTASDLRSLVDIPNERIAAFGYTGFGDYVLDEQFDNTRQSGGFPIAAIVGIVAGVAAIVIVAIGVTIFRNNRKDHLERSSEIAASLLSVN